MGDTVSVTNLIDNIPKDGCVQYFCPGHLGSKYQAASQLGEMYQYKAVTYLTFSPDGTELLANMGTEHIYLYDITRSRNPLVSSRGRGWDGSLTLSRHT